MMVSYCSLLMRASYRGVDLNVVIQRPTIRQVVTEPQNLTPSMMYHYFILTMKLLYHEQGQV